jgi:hypothetical protein
MRALHKDDADAEELADAILADVGIKGDGTNDPAKKD